MRKSAFVPTVSAVMALALIMPMGGLLRIESAHADIPQCSDGRDNDQNGIIDYPEDANCSSLEDDNEGPNNAVFVTVTDNRDQVAPGDALTYLITLKQQRQPVQLVDVALRVPPQNNIVSSSDDGTILDGRVVWYKVAVFKNNIRRLQVHVSVSPNVNPGQLLVAQVAAEGMVATDTTIVSNRVIPYPQNQLQVSVTDNRDNAQPGDALNYIVSVHNPEPNGTTFHVRVKIPVALRILDAGGANFLGNEIYWSNVTLNPYESRDFTFSASVDNRVPNHYPIQVAARAGNVVGYDRTIVGGGPGPYALFSTITDNRETAQRGDLLTYVVHIDNTSGRLDTNASIDAGLPIYGEFVSATEGGTWDGNNIRWLHMQVAPGGSRDLAFTVRVRSDAPQSTILRGTVMVQGFTSSDQTQVVGYGAARNGPLSIEKSTDQPYATAGSTVAYTVTARNTNGSNLRNVTVTDSFDPSALQIIDAGRGYVRSGHIRWTVGTLRPGEVRTFRYNAMLSRDLQGGDAVQNSARASSDQIDYAPTAITEQVVLPQTGIEDFFGPLENTQQFLTPISAAAEGNGLPLALWIAVIAMGLAGGAVIGKKMAA